MRQKPLLAKLGAAPRTAIEELFEKHVRAAKGKQYLLPLAGVTKKNILKNRYLRTFWVYWYQLVPLPSSTERGLEKYEGRPAKCLEFAADRLDTLIFHLWKLSQMGDNDVTFDIENRQKIEELLNSSGGGRPMRAIESLQDAAINLGYMPDHFIRSVSTNSIRRLEGESAAEYEMRRVAVELYRLTTNSGYLKSGKQEPKLRTHALRRIWPLLDIDLPTLKLLFLTENGSHRHAAALNSILCMASPDFKLDTSTINWTLNSTETED